MLDDWQGVARCSADWPRLAARAEVVFFPDAFQNEDAAAAVLADFAIVLSMRERTPLPTSWIARLPKPRMLGITDARVATTIRMPCKAELDDWTAVYNEQLRSRRWCQFADAASWATARQRIS